MKYLRHAVVIVCAVAMVLFVVALSRNRIPGFNFQVYSQARFVGKPEKIREGMFRMQTVQVTVMVIGIKCVKDWTIDLPFTSRKGEPWIIDSTTLSGPESVISESIP